MRKVIAIDFDGCLCDNIWPEIGAPHWSVIRAAQLAQHEGAALILWTCRNGDLLDAAVEWCREHGLVFDAVNENLPERLEHYGTESRKVSADEYWDDRAVHMPAPPNAPLTLDELREMDGETVYIERINNSYIESGWALVYREWCGCKTASGCVAFFERYGEFWLAYRRKPEEGI